MIKNKRILILLIAVIVISSIGTVNAQGIDENQTDNLEIESPADNDSQEVLSAPDSPDQILESSNDEPRNSAYLVLDNDADNENVNVGDYVTWILEAQNMGPSIAKNVKIYDKLPKGMKYIKHNTAKGTFNPETGTWDIGNLTPEEGLVTLLITVKAITPGEKVNKAYITSDTTNTNHETFEEEEIDVFSNNQPETHEFEKHASAKMHETGNPLFLIFACLFILAAPIVKR